MTENHFVDSEGLKEADEERVFTILNMNYVYSL